MPVIELTIQHDVLGAVFVFFDLPTALLRNWCIFDVVVQLLLIKRFSLFEQIIKTIKGFLVSFEFLPFDVYLFGFLHGYDYILHRCVVHQSVEGRLVIPAICLSFDWIRKHLLYRWGDLLLGLNQWLLLLIGISDLLIRNEARL